MDGEDSRFVETAHGVGQPADGDFPIRHQIQQPDGEIVVLGGTAAQEGEADLDQSFADAVAQFLGGGVGVSDHQDTADRNRGLDHQPQVQRGDGVGLASAGAGFDQIEAAQGCVKRVEAFHVDSSIVGLETDPILKTGEHRLRLSS